VQILVQTRSSRNQKLSQLSQYQKINNPQTCCLFSVFIPMKIFIISHSFDNFPASIFIEKSLLKLLGEGSISLWFRYILLFA
jgi:hypothetical protein